MGHGSTAGADADGRRFAFWPLKVCAARAGIALFAVCMIFFTFPLWAEQAPGFLWGVGKTPTELVRAYAMGFESIVGLPMRLQAIF